MLMPRKYSIMENKPNNLRYVSVRPKNEKLNIFIATPGLEQRLD